jgi:threonine 3-dehydrogenase
VNPIPEDLMSNNLMKAVRKTKREPGLELVEVEIPRLKPDEVLLKVEATAICGSDVHFYTWDAFAQSKLKPPLTIGHEFAGEIVDVGLAVTQYRVGDYATADSHIVCGKCDMCKMGLQHICQHLKIFGNEVDGSFAQYVAVPETSLWRLSRDIPANIGAILEPLGGATQAVLVEPVTAQNVVILGDGPIGLFAAGVAKAAGARRVYHVGIIPVRLEIAKKMGAHAVFNNREEPDVVEKILADTHGLGADVVIDASGAPSAIQQAFKLVRKGGRVTLFGITSEPVLIDVNYAIILRQVRVHGVAGRHMWNTWRQLEGLLASGLLDPSPVITCDLPLEKFDQGFQQMVSKQCGKVILRPWS